MWKLAGVLIGLLVLTSLPARAQGMACEGMPPTTALVNVAEESQVRMDARALARGVLGAEGDKIDRTTIENIAARYPGANAITERLMYLVCEFIRNEPNPADRAAAMERLYLFLERQGGGASPQPIASQSGAIPTPPSPTQEACTPFDSDFSQYRLHGFIGKPENNLVSSEYGERRAAKKRRGGENLATYEANGFSCRSFSEINIDFGFSNDTGKFEFLLNFGRGSSGGVIDRRFSGNGMTYIFILIDGGELAIDNAPVNNLKIIHDAGSVIYYLNGEHVTTLAHGVDLQKITLSQIDDAIAIVSVRVK